MSLVLKVEAEPSSTISDSFKEACILANHLNVTVEFDFNRVTCIALVNGNPERGVEEYKIECNSPKLHKIAVARP